jgi:hypothetical protein
VNFVLKDQYNGGDVYNYFGISQRGDDETYHGSFTGGLTQKFSDTSNLSIVAVFDYLSQGPILGKDRANTTQQLSTLSFKFPNHPLFPSPTGQFVNQTTGAFIQTKQGFNGVNPTANDFVSAPFDQFSLNGLEIQPRESRLGGTVKLTSRTAGSSTLTSSIERAMEPRP